MCGKAQKASHSLFYNHFYNLFYLILQVQSVFAHYLKFCANLQSFQINAK
jgi:hypothetical protein